MLLARRAFCAGLSAAAASSQAYARTPETPDALVWRGLELQDRDGQVFQLGQGPRGGGPATLVTMWAHWCPPCLSEMPSLARLASALGPQAQVLLISHPEYWAQDMAHAQRMGLGFRMATASRSNDRGAVRAALTVNGAYEVPRTLLFRGDGSLAWSRVGSMDWASSGAIAQVRALVG